MNKFKHPNTSHNWKCPICNTNDDKEVALIGVNGTEEGNIQTAEQIHVECVCNLEFIFFKENNILVAEIKSK